MALSDLRLSKNMKYTALYWAMRFFEHEPDIFVKTYSDGTEIKILANENLVLINGKKVFSLDTHESFVKLEFIDSYIKNKICSLKDLKIKKDSLHIFDKEVRFFVWDDKFSEAGINENDIGYKSRLISGVIESETKFFHNGSWFDYWDGIQCWNNKTLDIKNKDFVVEGTRLMRYIGKDKVVNIPEGIKVIESCAFWDNQFIEEIKIPNEVVNIGGDTFYNCRNLKKINIPEKCTLMGNNPFAGCPDVEILNESKNFILEDGALYTADRKTLIYYAIKGSNNKFNVPEGVEVICKHTFFLCDRLEHITLPVSLKKMENNPFSGCSKLSITNKSKAYHIIDDVIYNQFKTAIVGTLNKISTDCLIIPEGTKTINRNSFWNCKGIKKIVFPKSLVDIGYNPFVGCSNIHFESKSDYYKVVDDVLFTADLSKIVCYPSWKAVGDVELPDSVITLERGAFSGCDLMKSISLHNVNIINKSCFTNCFSLENVYCSDLISYIGEWAFAYDVKLRKISVGPNTIIDNNAFSNCKTIIEKRDKRSNYIIESENLYTLKALLKNYKVKIDSILIDPPYNSNIDYIGYKDSSYEKGYVNFMKERILLAKQLLSKKGFLVINIDEGEVGELTSLCELIFDNEFVSVHRWKKKHPFFDANRVVLNPNKKQTDYEFIIVCRNSKEAILKNIKQPFICNNSLKEKDSEFPVDFDCFGTTSSAKDEINEIFGTRDYFSTPKPVKLIKEFARATTDKESIVLDFFAGSGTTGQAIYELNKEDKGKRTFILVSNSESNICRDVTLKRLNHIKADFTFLN